MFKTGICICFIYETTLTILEFLIFLEDYVFYISIRYLTWHYEVFKTMGINGPKPVVLFGTMIPMMKKGLLQNDIDLYKMYGKIRGAFQGRVPFLVIHDVEILKEILVKRFDKFSARFNIGFFDSPLDKMIITVEGDHWRLIRNIITPTFSSGKLRKMNQKLNDCASTICNNLSKLVKDGKTFDFRKYTGAFTMDAICSTAFGMKIDSNDSPDNIFIRMAHRANDFQFKSMRTIIFFFFPFLLKPLRFLGLSVFPRDIINFFTDVFHKAVEARSTVDEKEKDFLQLMINAHSDEIVDEEEMKHKYEDELKWTRKSLTNDEIVSNSILFFVAGYETTANTISLIGYHLAIYPDIQEKLYQEIKEITKNGKAEITFDLVQKINYLDMCLNETLRIYPPGPRTDRVAKNDITINELFIPKGMNIVVPIYALHMDPQVWENPTKFDPERFSPEGRTKWDPNYFMPFSMGPRKCVGMRLALMEIKIFFARVLLQFKLVRAPETEIPLEMDKLATKAAHGIQILAEERR